MTFLKLSPVEGTEPSPSACLTNTKTRKSNILRASIFDLTLDTLIRAVDSTSQDILPLTARPGSYKQIQNLFYLTLRFIKQNKKCVCFNKICDLESAIRYG
ncbi:hypothetical protein BpHYR1_050302 [Brachionus plicatilis]|uniref:Uncharacterized protein n=1 Tax=Brachionus plicatilis TaxID=10195 RepID=A0A3M7R3N2_BRAPC|nr:hypothetical protein BpHYR1_050302 [Brachionus plicatilis]